MKTNYSLATVILLLSFVACIRENDNNLPLELKYQHFPGKYIITSIYSDRSIDLNGDGNISDDLFSQITGATYSDIEKREMNFPFINLKSVISEIRPYSEKSKDETPYAIIYFPQQNILENNNNTQLRNYIISNFEWQYEFECTGNVKLKEIINNCQYPTNKIFKLARIDKDKFRMLITENLYDFSDNKWKASNIQIIYERVDQ